MFSLNDRITFGKYKPVDEEGKLIKWIIQNDPEYILWCLENIEWFELDTDAEEMLEWEMADLWD